MKFLDKKYTKETLKLALPVMLTQVGQVSVNLFDNIIVGKLLGAKALASVSLANSLFFSIFVFGLGFSLAIPPLVSEAHSQNNHSKINSIFSHGFVVNLTVGLFLEDYLPTNKNFKVHLNMLYGSNMSYNIPGSVRYRNGLIIDPYIRVDIGFSALLLSEKSARRSHSPFKSFENIWASLEVFNLINRDNTISYQLIKDFSNTTYAIPNRLTPRLLNFKIIGRF